MASPAPHSTPRSRLSQSGSRTGGCAVVDKPPMNGPEPTARAVAYIRESTEEQGKGFSPDAQREAIRKFAAENDLELSGEYSDFHSGWRKADARPHFQRLMADAAAQRFDVVLVYHTSRFARNQSEARRYKQLLRERLGIRVVSVTQPMGEDPSDPSVFLAESIHEMFDEYYSVSLSFWTRTGLREKARQGHLVGILPWGYVRDPDTRLAVPDPERALLVRELFERYATGQESDRTMAAWLNAKGVRTSRGRAFSKDTVRDMLLNAAYCGYVTGMRSKDRSIKGLHEPLVPEKLFDRVQQMRTWRARIVKPGRPSEDYLLRKLLYCERCGARMHGNKGSSPQIRRYLCSTRRYGGDCKQPIARAEPLEEQIVEWLRDFQPDEELRAVVLASVREVAKREGGDELRRGELIGQLERLRDLYVMGDLTKEKYVINRQAIEEELERMGPPLDPQLDQAEAVLRDFTRFWDSEPKAAERRKLIASLFDRVWEDEGKIVAVKPREPFLRYFKLADEAAQLGTGANSGGKGRDAQGRENPANPHAGVKSGSDGTRTRDLRRDRPAL
jgi:site-specific DNA recombinase